MPLKQKFKFNKYTIFNSTTTQQQKPNSNQRQRCFHCRQLHSCCETAKHLIEFVRESAARGPNTCRHCDTSVVDIRSHTHTPADRKNHNK